MTKALKRKASREKVQSYRKRMRAKGYRLMQMWVPDTRTPEFAAEAHWQSLLAAKSEQEAEDMAFADTLAEDLLAELDRSE